VQHQRRAAGQVQHDHVLARHGLHTLEAPAVAADAHAHGGLDAAAQAEGRAAGGAGRRIEAGSRPGRRTACPP